MDPTVSYVTNGRTFGQGGDMQRLFMAAAIMALMHVGAANDEPLGSRAFVNDWANIVLTEALMHSVAFAPDGTLGIAVGSDGTILRTLDGGKSWTRPLNGSGTQRHLSAVQLINEKVGVAVGDGSTL